jgi:polyphenol oxidase
VVIERAALRPSPAGQPWCAVDFAAGAGSREARGAHGVRAGISLLAAGDMGLAVRQTDPSFGRFLAALAVDPALARAVRQVHSRTVVEAGPREAEIVEADGIVSRDPRLFLTVTVADCLPVFLLDRATGAFGVVHSGWKGTGIAAEAIRLMAATFGTRPGDVTAAIGPGIGPCCYTVPAERCRDFRARFGPDCVPEASRLDLRRANIALLEAEGVGSISVVEECTACSARLGSFRRQGAGRPEYFTRMLAFIGTWT